MGHYPLGVVFIAFAPLGGVEASVRARELGFDHIDAMADDDPAELALPVGCPVAFPKPRPGWCATPAPVDGHGRWEWTVERFRAAPGCLLEPWPGSCVNSLEKMEAIAQEVPGLRFLVDTGHVASWGEDPIEALAYADHVQLRQGRPGQTQLHVDDPGGVVDFSAVIRRLDRIGYRGRLSVEHFDLPEQGCPLDDPVGWSVDLAARVRTLFS